MKLFQSFLLLLMLVSAISAAYFNAHATQAVIFSETKAMSKVFGVKTPKTEEYILKAIKKLDLPRVKENDDEMQIGFREDARLFELDKLLQTPFLESWILVFKLLLKRINFYLTLNLFLIAFWVAIIVDALIERKIRIASFVAPKPVLFKSSLGLFYLISLSLIIVFTIPVAVPPLLWLVVVFIQMLLLHTALKNYQRFY